MTDPKATEPNSELDHIDQAKMQPPIPIMNDEKEDLPMLGERGITEEDDHRNVTEHDPRHFREDPVAYMSYMAAYYQGTGWRKYDNYIGEKILYPGYSQSIKEAILKSPRVRQTIETMALRQHEALLATTNITSLHKRRRQQKALEQEIEAIAKGIADKLVATMDSVRPVRAFAFAVNSILVRMYNQGIHIRESEFVELRRVAMEAQATKTSLILLPTHKSHIDYLVISYIFFRLGFAIPHIVAGDNLDLPLLGNLLKSSGAFFIRRSWGDDALYKSVVEEYLEELMSRGLNLECFIEGTRSRTGKLLTPKFGILKIVLDCILNGRATDAMIVPISIDYDKVIETEGYVTELLGAPKEKESLGGLMSSAKLLQVRYGSIHIGVSKPFSLKDWISEQLRLRHDFTPTNPEQKITLLKSLGYRILADINKVSEVMPTALVGTVILTLRGRGVGISELIRRVDWLKQEVMLRKGHVAEFKGMSTEVIVKRSVVILKELIAERKDKDIIEPTFYAVNRFELSYYRNQVIHLFIEDAIISVALYSIIKKGGAKSTQRMTLPDLLDEVAFLSSLLKVDFIFNPGVVPDNVERTLTRLEREGVLERTLEKGVWWIGLSDCERNLGRENYDFFCFLIWPFVETYWLGAVCLLTLTPPLGVDPQTYWVDEPIFSKKSQALGKTLYFQGDLSYLEAVNKETLKNAFIRFEEQKILRIRRSKESVCVSLDPEWVPERSLQGNITPQERLWLLVERISNFRREGKNRRDNATVSTRVLRLTELVGGGFSAAKL